MSVPQGLANFGIGTLAARRSGPSLPCHCALSCFKSSAGGARSRPSKSPGAPGAGGRRRMPGPARPRPIAYARPRIVCEAGRNGALHCRSSESLAPHDPSLARLFRAAVERNPAGLFLAERDGGGWRKLTYAAARPLVDVLAQSLIERGLSAERPVMVLSANGIDHALLMLAGHTAGIPVAPISVAYSLQSQDHAKLKHIAALLAPGLIYVADTSPFAKALAALDLGRTELVASRNGANVDGVTSFAAMARARPGPALENAVAAIGGATIAKFLFTSGSTDLPKGVFFFHGTPTTKIYTLSLNYALRSVS